MNLIAILILGRWALKALDDYSAQRKAGKDPVFVADGIQGFPQTQCWHIGQDDLKDVGPEPVREYVREALAPNDEA
jgi:alanine or glycine:cation symporter, AGCS family